MPLLPLLASNFVKLTAPILIAFWKSVALKACDPIVALPTPQTILAFGLDQESPYPSHSNLKFHKLHGEVKMKILIPT